MIIVCSNRVSTRDQFVEGVHDQMKELWDNVDDRWNLLRSALCENACRKQPDWFKDNESLLLLSFERRIFNNKWLSTGLE